MVPDWLVDIAANAPFFAGGAVRLQSARVAILFLGQVLQRGAIMDGTGRCQLLSGWTDVYIALFVVLEVIAGEEASWVRTLIHDWNMRLDAPLNQLLQRLGAAISCVGSQLFGD